MIIGALVFHAMMENIYGDRQENAAGSEPDQIVYNPEETDNPAYFVEIPPDTVFPSPETEEEIAAALNEEEEEDVPISIISDPKSEVQNGTYTLYIEDLSWTAAQEKCASMGGHLVTISNQEELDKVISMAEEQGIEKVWIGCHRENGKLVWENYETIDFYKWGKGEPSEYDKGDNVSEDYVMLWKFNGEWVYNDSRNDPVADYPAMYSGKIAYVCEDY
jgi:Lectin C-type domain.